MTHRDKSLTPWITPNGADLRQKTILPPSVYDAATAQGCDMQWFVRQELIIEHKLPTGAEMRAEIKRRIEAGEPLGTSHVPTIKGDVFTNGSVKDYSKIEARVRTLKDRR